MALPLHTVAGLSFHPLDIIKMLGIKFLSLCRSSGTIICKPQQTLSARMISLIPAANVIRILRSYWPHFSNCPSVAAYGPCPTTLPPPLSLHSTSPSLWALDSALHPIPPQLPHQQEEEAIPSGSNKQCPVTALPDSRARGTDHTEGR